MNKSQTPVNTATQDDEEKRKHRIRAAAFLGVVGGMSALFGFSRAVVKAKHSEQKLIQQNGRQAQVLMDEGAALAMRALGWGTLYAILGTGSFCYGIWKLSGAKNMEEFRLKMGQKLPRITSDKPPTSRTEFEGLSDLMNYLATWGKE